MKRGKQRRNEVEEVLLLRSARTPFLDLGAEVAAEKEMEETSVQLFKSLYTLPPSPQPQKQYPARIKGRAVLGVAAWLISHPPRASTQSAGASNA